MTVLEELGMEVVPQSELAALVQVAGWAIILLEQLDKLPQGSRSIHEAQQGLGAALEALRRAEQERMGS